MTAKQLCKKLVAIKRRLAKERDRLRELVEEVDELESECDRAIASIEDAADALSELQ